MWHVILNCQVNGFSTGKISRKSLSDTIVRILYLTSELELDYDIYVRIEAVISWNCISRLKS